MAITPVFPLVNNPTYEFEQPVSFYTTQEGLVAAGFYPQKSTTLHSAPTVTTGIEYDSGNAYLVVKTEGTKISFQMTGNEYAFIDANGVNAGKLDAPAGVALTIGGTNATGITIGKAGVVTNVLNQLQEAGSRVWTAATFDPSTKAAVGQTMYIGTTGVAINRASANLALTGISSVTMPGATSGTCQLIPTAAAGTGTVLTLPATTGTVALTSQLPTVNDAGLTLQIGTAGATNTSITIGTGTGFTANDATPTTYDIKVGPGITALVGQMTGATAGFLKKTAQDTLTVATISIQDVTDSPYKDAAKVATTAALTATYSNGTAGVGATLTNSGTLAALAIDGVTLAVNDRVLVKNQATAAQNGIYAVTNAGSASVAWILTRTADSDTAAELAGAVITIDQGTANGGGLFTDAFKSTDTVGTTACNWYTIWHQGNDGTGSGLDADLLDGHDTSYFATAGQTMYIGTTGVAINRGSGTLNLAGIGSLTASGLISTGNVQLGYDTSGTSVATGVYMDGSNNLVLKDAVTGTKTLAQLIGGGVSTATVSASYTTSTTQSLTGGTLTRVNFETQAWDTNSAVTTGAGTWKFTAPVTGTYHVDSALLINGASGHVCQIAIYKAVGAGSMTYYRAGDYQALTSNGYGRLQMSADVVLSAGDSLAIYAQDMSGTASISNLDPQGCFVNVDLISVVTNSPVTGAVTGSISARYNLTSQTFAATNGLTRVNFANKDWDSNNAVTTGSSWKFTAPVAGTYHISALVTGISTGGTVAILTTNLYKNTDVDPFIAGSRCGAAGDATNGSTLSGDIVLNAGDYIYIQVFANYTGTLGVQAQGYANYISIDLLGTVGNLANAQTAIISAGYTVTAAQNIPNASLGTNAIVNFDAKTWDSNNAVTTGSGWKFTAPTTGNYHVTATVDIAVPAGTAGDALLTIFKNGTEYRRGSRISPSATGWAGASTWTVEVSATVALSASDYIDIRCYQSTGGSVRALDTTANLNHVSVDFLGGNVIGGNGNFYLFKAGDKMSGPLGVDTIESNLLYIQRPGGAAGSGYNNIYLKTSFLRVEYVDDTTPAFVLTVSSGGVASLTLNGQIQCTGVTTSEARNSPTFINSWVNYGGGFSTAVYWKDPNNVVHLEGLIKSGILSSPAFTLPAGYRPTLTQIFCVQTNPGGVVGRVDVSITGTVTPGTGCSNAWVSLDGISFYAGN